MTSVRITKMLMGARIRELKKFSGPQRGPRKVQSLLFGSDCKDQV